VVIARWPGEVAPGAAGALAPLPSDPLAELEISALMRLVTEVRRFRSDQGLRPGQQVPARLAGIGGTALAQHEGRIRALLRLTEPGPGFVPTATVHAEGVAIELDTAAGLDVGAERKRLAKDLAAARTEIDAMERKLANASFVERAPAEVVAKNRDRLASAQDEAARLAERIAALPAASTSEGLA
jgi:valyl-tRNA synthetase